MTGLSAEVPSRQFCEQMSAAPALAEAFKASALVWATMDAGGGWFVTTREGTPTVEDWPELSLVSAPTVREMQVWLKLDIDDGLLYVFDDRGHWVFSLAAFALTDPDALAEACLRAAKGQP